MKEEKMKREKEREIEKKVVRILTEERLSAIKAMLEKDHAIDCVFLLMLGRGQWRYAKEFMTRLRLTLPDGTFRARMIEIEDCGLAKHEKMDIKKKRWIISEFGKQVGRLLFGFFAKIDRGGSM